MRPLPIALLLTLGAALPICAQRPAPKPSRATRPSPAAEPSRAPEPAPAAEPVLFELQDMLGRLAPTPAVPGQLELLDAVTLATPMAPLEPTMYQLRDALTAMAPVEASAFAIAGQQVQALDPMKGAYMLAPRAARSSFAEPSWRHPDNPEDSAYRVARETLNRGEYRRAAEQFASFAQKYPQSRYRPAAVYYQSFALYRAGTEAYLRRALGLLDDLAKTSANSETNLEVTALLTRVVGTLASRGDASAASRLKQGASEGLSECDREDVDVRAEALSALVQNDPEGSNAVLRRILSRRDECSVPLRRRAVYLLGKDGDVSKVDEVLEIAKNDPSKEVRSDAISRLAQIPGDRSTMVLEQFLTASTDEQIQRAVVRALRGRDDPTAAKAVRRVIEREDAAESVRTEAIRSLVGSGEMVYVLATTGSQQGQRVPTRKQPVLADGDIALLRGVYDRTASRAVKAAIVETIARSGGPATDAWLVSMVRNTNEDLRFRTAALSRLRRSETDIGELTKLYDALTERELRSTLVQVLGEREEPAATDKLFEIAKTGTDPAIRRAAISALARKKDPRTTKLLLDMVEK